MSHHCHAEGCTKQVPPRMFACLPHWRMVPVWLQKKLWAAYTPGQERTKEVSPWYVIVQTRCRLAIAEHESSLHAPRVRREFGNLFRSFLAEDSPEKGATDEEVVEAFDAEVRA